MNDAVEISMNNNGELNFPIELINVGNGTSIGVQLMIEQRIVYSESLCQIDYYQIEPMSANVVQTGNKVSTVIKCNFVKGAHEVELKLQFEDMMERQYIQKFHFLYAYEHDNGIMIQHYFSPECVKDYYYDKDEEFKHDNNIL